MVMLDAIIPFLLMKKLEVQKGWVACWPISTAKLILTLWRLSGSKDQGLSTNQAASLVTVMNLRNSFQLLSYQNPMLMRVMKVAWLLSCVQLFGESIDSSLPGSSVHGILQARTLEWVAISYSRGSSRPRDWIHISYAPCIGRWIL